MPRISTASLIAALWLVPAALAGPAFAFVQLAETLDSAAAASVQHDAAGLSQDHIKEIFFDAARQGRDDLLDGLIRSGMKPDERDAKGYTALILAAYNGQAKTVDLLIQKGANPCAADAKGNSSLMGVAFKGETGIAQRLIAAHCDVNARNDAGQTALMMAAMFGRTDVVKMLLVNGANPELQDQAGNTAVKLAQQQVNPQMVTLLTEAVKGQ
ncbi:MAG: ankyrin repeat protein [Tardiphaga sp.]|jgi:ankyrin repeat protein|nr:ankyrin repeat protein [Tardiphaga sp.]